MHVYNLNNRHAHNEQHIGIWPGWSGYFTRLSEIIHLRLKICIFTCKWRIIHFENVRLSLWHVRIFVDNLQYTIDDRWYGRLACTYKWVSKGCQTIFTLPIFIVCLFMKLSSTGVWILSNGKTVWVFYQKSNGYYRNTVH